nr:lipoprotein-releasing system permease protein [Candidatus Cloacimonadota bacterium]
MDRLETFFLKRYIKHPKRNLFRFSFVFMVIGIILSVGILSAGLNLFQGYETNLKSLLLDSFPHVSIQSAYGELISQAELIRIKNKLAQKSEILSLTGSIESSLMVQTQDKVRAVNLRAYDFSEDFPYARYISKGSYDLQPKELIVGHYLAEELGLKIGDELILSYPRLDRITPLGIQNNQSTFTIAAIYRSGYYESDNSLVISTISDAKSLLMISDGYSKVELRLSDPDKASQYSREYIYLLGSEYIAIPWDLYAQSLLRLVTMEKWLIFIVFSFLVLIAGINVISAMSTIIIDKTREIAVLKTLGAGGHSIKRIFSWHVGLVALLAVIGGQILGLLLSWFVEIQSFYRLKGEVYFIDTLTADITWVNLAVVFAVSNLLIFACINIPLKQIENMQIIDIIRQRN